MSPHLVYIAFWYPPARASGVYRALATTERFVAAGWRVTVITTSKEFLEDEVGSTDPSLESFIPETVDLIRVPFTLTLDPSVDVGDLNWWSANFPGLQRGIRERVQTLRRNLFPNSESKRRKYDFSDNYVTWIDPVVEAGLEIDQANAITHVLATGNPFSSFEAARIISSRVGAPFSVDYRDPWTVDVFTGRPDASDRKTSEVERRIVAESSLCFHVNESIAGAYRERYPDDSEKHLVVPNGYDQDSIPPPSGPSTGPLRFGILGTLNDRWPMQPIFEAWNEARADLPRGSELVLGGHLGYFEKTRDILEAAFPDESTGFRYLGPVAKDRVSAFYESLDVLVLPVPGGRMVTSGKVYEALAVGKPFVCVQDADGGARRLTSEHPLGFGADPEAHEVKKALLAAARAAEGLDVQTSRSAQMGAQSLERSRTLDRLVEAVAGSGLGAKPA